MEIRNPDYRNVVADLFRCAPFIQHLQAQLLDCGPGYCESRILLQPCHRQQNGYVHAGAQATLADHTAGCAAATVMGPDEIVLTIEFKINLLRPARGESLLCRGQVLKAGRRVTVAESEVMAEEAGRRVLVSKASVTLAFVGQ